MEILCKKAERELNGAGHNCYLCTTASSPSILLLHLCNTCLVYQILASYLHTGSNYPLALAVPLPVPPYLVARLFLTGAGLAVYSPCKLGLNLTRGTGRKGSGA